MTAPTTATLWAMKYEFAWECYQKEVVSWCRCRRTISAIWTAIEPTRFGASDGLAVWEVAARIWACSLIKAWTASGSSPCSWCHAEKAALCCAADCVSKKLVSVKASSRKQNGSVHTFPARKQAVLVNFAEYIPHSWLPDSLV